MDTAEKNAIVAVSITADVRLRETDIDFIITPIIILIIIMTIILIVITAMKLVKNHISQESSSAVCII